MKLSVKSDYAARAVLALAQRHQEGLACRVEDLAGENGIPANYLAQILIELKSNNIVKSQRGKEGGYLLARPPVQISLGDILRSVHGQVFDTPALTDAQCPVELRESWRLLQKKLEDAADGITFQDLLESRSSKEKMYYI